MVAIPWAFLCMRPIKKTTQGAGGQNEWGNQKKAAGYSHNAIKNVATEGESLQGLTDQSRYVEYVYMDRSISRAAGG